VQISGFWDYPKSGGAIWMRYHGRKFEIIVLKGPNKRQTQYQWYSPCHAPGFKGGGFDTFKKEVLKFNPAFGHWAVEEDQKVDSG